MNGMDIARQRIAEEAKARTSMLDLGQLGLTRLPDELFELTHLRRLNLGSNFVSEKRESLRASADLATNLVQKDLDRLVELPELDALFLCKTPISDLAPVRSLRQLRTLDCAGTLVKDLAPIAGLNALDWLNCQGTAVSDLSPVAGLKAIRQLICADTSVSDLTPIAGLACLERLDCTGTSVSDLMPIGALPLLKWLNCSGTLVKDLTPIAGLKALKWLNCTRTSVSDLAPLAELTDIVWLDCTNTLVSDLTPLAGLTDMAWLICMNTPVSDLMPIAGLTALEWLDCTRTSVSDLTPIAGLKALELLDCTETLVSDLTPITGLTALEHFDCTDTLVSDLAPIAGLTALEWLDCTGSVVSDLMPIAGLTALEHLDCMGTSVSDLTPVAGLKALKWLNCTRTSVSNLAPLAGLTALEHLDCMGTSVSDLMPIAGLTALKWLNCTRTSVSDLTPIAELTALEWLNMSGNRIKSGALSLSTHTALFSVVAYETEVRGFPEEVLSQDTNENCLPAIRTHLSDLGKAPAPLEQVKLMILGNGRIGKTQISNRMRDLPYDDDADSTHGVTVTEAPIPGESGKFAIWDFGGQDIYHGTHALFLRSRAVFLLVWTPNTEDSAEHEYCGIRFRNQPLSWWLDYVRRFGSARSPLIVVQNQLDTDYDRGDHPALAPLRNEFTFCRSLAYSAATNEERGVLDAYLKTAANRFNPPLIGRGRLRVMEQLIEMRETDASMLADKRRHRTLSLAEFASICDEAGKVSDNRQLLRFLHNAGIVFWREGLFEDRIVLDQVWVLDAIYTVFNREKCLQALRLRAGWFTRQELGWMVWNENYSSEEQDLFVSFMRSCGICFKLSKGNPSAQSTYIAPDLLPDSWLQQERAELWGEEPADYERSFAYESLPPALMRNLICRIGEHAGIRCNYWRNGLYGYEVETASRVLLEQEIQDDWRGEIRVQTRGGSPHELLNRMFTAISEEEQRLGLTGTELSKTRYENVNDTEAMLFDNEPDRDRDRTFYVSYAWADREEAPAHSSERIVDEFCAAAAALNIKIHRDRNDMIIGERISAFMNQLARANRVIVVLSDKYLKSTFCMTELYEIWLQSRGESDRFLKRVRVYTEDGAHVWTMASRAKYAVHWKVEYEKIDSIVKEHGFNVLGDQDKLKFGQMKKFHVHIGDILGALTDVLQPQSLDELITYSFEDEDFDDT